MPRKFKTANYEETLDQKVSLREVLPPNHLARFVVDIISQLDLSSIYSRYTAQGGEPFAPEILLGLLFYGYATGVFSSRKIEKGTYESIPFRFIAGGLHPDHDTIANFRKTFLAELKELFVQILLLAQAVGLLKLGNLSLDGNKIHADASKSKAVSYKRLIEIEARLRQEVQELFDLAGQADQSEIRLPDGLSIPDEIALRQERLANLAKAVLEARAQERYEAEKAEYEAKLRAREQKAAKTERKRGGRKPKPPQPGPRPKDQYNFTDPDSRIMKNSTNAGFDQHYNVQAAVDQATLLVVAPAVSNHPNDKGEAEATLAAVDPALGQAVAMDNGYFSPANLQACAKHRLEAYIATGREPHQRSWHSFFAQLPEPPSEEASATVKMAYKLRTEMGQAIYRLRKCTVEPVIGIIKEVLGFRQFSLRGLDPATGEWWLVCLAFNLKRLHTLWSRPELIP